MKRFSMFALFAAMIFNAAAVFAVNDLASLIGKSGNLTNELNYSEKQRAFVTNPTADNRWRIGTGEGGGTYSITLPNDYSLLGVLWAYIWKDSHVTIDGRGADFGQFAREDGSAVNNVCAQCFIVNNNAYGNYQVELHRSGNADSSFRFTDSLQTFVRDSAAGLFQWNLTQGTFSFAESSRPSSMILVLGNSSSKPDRVFEMNMNNVTSYFPTAEVRCYNTNNYVNVDGGKLQLKDYLKFDHLALLKSGTNEISFVNGAHVEQTGGGIVLGSAADVGNPGRAVRMSFDGEGTKYTPPSGYSEIFLRGRSRLDVTGGAVFKVGELMYVGTKDDTHVDCPLVSVSGEGSLFDASATRLFRFYRDGAMEVRDGASAILPADTKFGESHVGSNAITVGGEGSRLLFTNTVTVAETGAAKTNTPLVVLGYAASSTCTVSVVDGGYFGFADGSVGLLRMGQNENTFGKLNIDGGRVVLPNYTADGTYIGYNSSAELNVTAGELIVSNIVRCSALANPAIPYTSVIRQSGGNILFYNGITLNYAATKNFTADMYLTGGTLVTDTLTAGNTAISRVHANGGTVKPRQRRVDRVWTLCHGIDLFEIGSKGFTLDTDGKDASVRQYFTNFVDEAGLFVKQGAGTLIFYTNRFDVAKLKMAGGTLQIGMDNAVFNTALALDPLAALSMRGECSKLTLSSLAVTNATISLDPGDEIVVEGDASFAGLKLDFSSIPDAEDAAGLLNLKVKGALDESSRKALMKVVCDNAIASGRHLKVSVTTDETGETLFKVENAPDAEELGEAANTVWTGNGLWYSPVAWSMGVPDGGKRAVFDAAGLAAKDVAVGNNAQIGAIGFDADGYRLSGGELVFATPKGAAVIEVEGGSHEIASPVVSGTQLEAKIAQGGSLTLSGAIVSRGLDKYGSGWLDLSGDFSDMGTLSFDSGSVRFRPETAGCAFDSLTVRSSQDGSPAIVCAESETTVRHFDVAGSFIKRGAEKFILDVRNSNRTSNLTTVKPATDYGQPAGDCSLNFGFPEDGSAPEGGYGGFTVAEGEFVIKGEGGSPVVRAKGSCVIGMNSTNTTGRASLTVDGATLDNYNGAPGATHFFVGCGAAHYQNGGRWQVDPTLRLVNGAVLKIDTLKTGHSFWGYYETHPTIAMTNSVIWSAYPYLTTLDSPISYPKWFTKNSRILAHPVEGRLINVHSAIEAIFDSTYIGAGNMNTLEPNELRMPMGNNNWSYGSAKGRVAFVNGSKIRVSDFLNYDQIQNPFTYVWDDSEWDYGGGDYVFEAAKFHADNFKFEMQGRGLVLKPASGSTFTVEFPFTGEGGFVNAGEGTVKFASGAYGFGGVCEVVSGTVDLTDAGALSSVKVKGEGTIKGLTASAVRIMASADEDWNVSGVPGFDALSAQRVTVDFGRSGASLSDELPKGIVLGKVQAGTDVSRWRIANTGYAKVSGRFSVSDDGTVSVDFERIGLAVIVR